MSETSDSLLPLAPNVDPGIDLPAGIESRLLEIATQYGIVHRDQLMTGLFGDVKVSSEQYASARQAISDLCEDHGPLTSLGDGLYKVNGASLSATVTELVRPHTDVDLEKMLSLAGISSAKRRKGRKN